MRKINDAGFDLIKSFESCSLTVYQDIKGIFTQGWGHISGITADSPPITQEQADDWLDDDLDTAEASVSNNITADLTDNQFSALVSLVFNCGNAPLLGHLGEYLNNGDYEAAADAFLQWCHAGGKVIAGLLRRREAEKALFQTPQ